MIWYKNTVIIRKGKKGRATSNSKASSKKWYTVLPSHRNPSHFHTLNSLLLFPLPLFSCPSLDIVTYRLDPQSPPHLPRLGRGTNVLGTTVWVCDGTGEANESVELISKRLVPVSALDSGGSTLASGYGGGVCLAHVGELVAERVGDDVWVQGFTLTAASEWVCDLEGEFVGCAAVLAALEGDGWRAEAEVFGSACSSGGVAGISTGVSVVVAVTCCGVLLVVCVVAVLLVVGCVVVAGISVVAGVSVVVAIAGCGVLLVVGVVSSVIVGVLLVVSCIVVACVGVVVLVKVASSVLVVCVALALASIGVVVLVGIVVTSRGIVISCGIVIGSSVVTSVVVRVAVVSSIASVGIAVTSSRLVATLSSTARSSSTTSRSLANDKVTETSLIHKIKHTQTISGKRRCRTALAKRRSVAVDVDIRVNKRSDTTELRSNGERSIATDVLDVAVGEGVGVLLSSYHANSSSKGIGTSTEFSEDLVCTDELFGLLAPDRSKVEVRVEMTYLVARVCCTEEIRDGRTGDSSGSTASTTLNTADSSDGDLLLTETCLDVGDDGRDDESLGNHVC